MIAMKIPSPETYTKEHIDSYLYVWAVNRLKLKSRLIAIKELARVGSGHRSASFKPFYICSGGTKKLSARGKNTMREGKSSMPSNFYNDEFRVAYAIQAIDQALDDKLGEKKSILPVFAFMHAFRKEPSFIMSHFQLSKGSFQYILNLIRQVVEAELKKLKK